ncbi:MAG: gliding motility-associated ABC transporter substrate-binding protein GldG [Saprospiraceae bacterium]|nr:gliding motility-associated ABC transporter substrate-binding protein GldG [Saprospiraceae bacterium]
MIFINILGNYFFGRIDLSQEKKFTLTSATKKLLANQKDIVYVKVLLEGEFPAGFKRLQKSTKEMLDDFRNNCPYIEYMFEDPNSGTTNDINARRKEMAKDGIVPVNLRVKDNNETTEKMIYPYAVFNFADRKVVVNLLENEIPGVSPDVVLNNSIGLLEYKFANAIEKLKSTKRANILFTEGQGELLPIQTQDLEKTLSQFYETGRLNLDSIVQIKKEVDILVIAKPTQPFDDKKKFKIDQYIMNGGKVIWLIDRMNAELDSMQNKLGDLVPYDYPLNIEDMLFKYGVRIQPNLVLDMECAKIPLRVGTMGNASQFDLFPWYYYPLVSPYSSHPVVKNLDRIFLQFPSSIDTIRTKSDVKKTVLLASSKYSRAQFTPATINFEILRYDADKTKFNKPYQPLAVLLEGNFASSFENRVSSEMQNSLASIGLPYKEFSSETKMIVVADGDIARNLVGKDGVPKPLGLSRFENRVYSSNKDFLLNSIEYMLDNNGIIDARTREVKLRMLDVVKAKNEETKWQLINIVTPLILLALFAFYYLWRRKKKYA